MAVNLTDAQIRNLFPTYFTDDYTGQLNVDKIRKILNTYSDKIGGRTYIANELKVNQVVVGRILEIAKAKKIIKQVPPGEFTATSQRKWTPENPRKIYKVIRPVEPRDYMKNPDIPKNAKFKAQVPGGSKARNTTMVYGATEEIVKNKMNTIEKANAASKLAKEKPFKDAVKTIHRIAMADPEDLNNVKNLSKMIYGADDVKNLTRTANDLVRYQEFLLGFRPIAGIAIPVGDKFDDIISEFPAMNQWGKFASESIRRSKLNIRDKLLKTKGPKLEKLRRDILRFVDSGAMELDEAMGVSATFERAPGYTELGQVIKKGINTRKGREIDSPFSKLLEKVVAGETGLDKEIKDFNQISKNFQKKWNVDTPIIEYKPGQKLDASKFVKHFDKLSPEAQVNVKELAGKGIAFRSKAMPMELLLSTFNGSSNAQKVKTAVALGCISAADGGRIGYALGTGTINCVNEKLTNQTAESSMKLRTAEGVGKIKNVAAGLLNFVKRGGKYGAIVAGGAAAAGLVKTFMNDDPTTYLSNEDQQKNMLISMVTNPIDDTPQEDPAVLDWQLPTLGAVTAAGMVPGGAELYKARRAIRPDKLIGPMEKGVGPVRAALGLKGVLGKGLAATATPLGLLALEPLHLAGQIQSGDSLTDIATNPLNYLGPTFASGLTKEATRFAGPTMSKIMRMGMSPTALKGLSKAGGYGLLASLGIQGVMKYDDWRNKRGWFSDD